MKREVVLAFVVAALLCSLAAYAAVSRISAAGKAAQAAREKTFDDREAALDMLDAMLAQGKPGEFDDAAATAALAKQFADLKPLVSFGEQLDLYACRFSGAGANQAETRFLFKCKGNILKDFYLWLAGTLDRSNADQLTEKGARWADGRLVESWDAGDKDVFTGKYTSQWTPGNFYYLKKTITNIRPIPYYIEAHFAQWTGNEILGKAYVHLGWRIAF